MANPELLVPPVQPEPAPPEPSAPPELRRTGRVALVLRRFARRPSALVGVALLVLLVVFAAFGPLISPWSYDDPDFMALTAPPSADHWLGTSTEGSDLFALVARGLGRSLLIGFLVSVVTMVVAALVGTAIAYFEGWVERVGMWLLDMLLVIPSFLLIAIIVGNSSGAQGWLWLALGLALFGWVGYARVLRTMTLSLRELDYVRAARFMGVPAPTIIVRHLIPNLASVLIINTVLGVVGAVNSETALSFLGLGIKAPDTSLGVLIRTGAGQLNTAPWLLIVPSVFLVLLTVSVQLIGDGLRDALDPASRSGRKPTGKTRKTEGNA